MKYSYLLLSAFLCVSCGHKKKGLIDMQVSENTSRVVNVIEQAKPKLMVIPSDRMLKEEKCLQVENYNGKSVVVRNITEFLLKSDQSHSIISSIQNYFIQLDYPLNDLEQTLKNLRNRQMVDEADGVAKDAKTLLLTTVSPDIVLELDYKETDTYGRTTKTKSLDFSLSAIDVYSNKVIASIHQNIKDKGLDDYLEKEVQRDLRQLDPQLKGYFTDVMANGREISFRVLLSQKSPIQLSDVYNEEGDSYADWIRRWVNVHAKNGTANMTLNTQKEMSFSNVRISNLAADGTQYNAYEFATQFRKDFYKTFSIQAVNQTQGLGNGVVMIK